MKRMTAAGLTKNALAVKSGLSWQNLDAVISGRRQPQLSTLRRIADAMGCKIADLLK